TFACCGLALAMPAASQPAVHTIRLIVDYNDGTQKVFSQLPWSKDMTVEDAIKLAKAAGHGISYVATGTGQTFFLTKIDDLQNEGGGAGKKNWQYWLNGQYAQVGAGSQKLTPDDVVRCKFAEYKP